MLWRCKRTLQIRIQAPLRLEKKPTTQPFDPFPKGACEFLLICVAILVASTCGLEGFKGAERAPGINGDVVWWKDRQIAKKNPLVT